VTFEDDISKKKRKNTGKIKHNSRPCMMYAWAARTQCREVDWWTSSIDDHINSDSNVQKAFRCFPIAWSVWWG